MKTIASKSVFLFIVVLWTVLTMGAVHAAGQHGDGFEVGILKCSAIPGSRVNLLVHSTTDIKCSFNNQGRIEHYKGETGIALGLDVSFKEDENMLFTVLAASSDTYPGAYALAGKYIGGQVAAAVGVGAGVKVLVGGGSKNFSLQPVALETNSGLGASGGLGFLYIEPDKY